MKKHTLVIFLLIILSLSCSTKSNRSIETTTLTGSLDSLLQTTIAEGLTPGVAIAVVSSTETLYAKAFGVKEIGKATALQTTDAFDFSSIVKTVVSTALMQLVEKNNVVLDNQASVYLPMLTGDLSQPTVRQMLSHSSGIQFSKQAPSLDGTLKSSDLTLGNSPGTKLQYSNAAFYTLGELVTEQANIPFADYVNMNIFKPLGMVHSSVSSYDAVSNLSMPHTILDNELTVVPRPEISPRKIGNGIFYSTIEDMAIWAQIHLNRGVMNEKRLLSANSYEQLWTPNLATGWDQMKAAAGLGWFIGTVNDKKTASHIGGTNGYSAALVIFPDHDRAIVIAGNSNKLPREVLIEAITKLILPHS